MIPFQCHGHSAHQIEKPSDPVEVIVLFLKLPRQRDALFSSSIFFSYKAVNPPKATFTVFFFWQTELHFLFYTDLHMY
jgi:hypothetical protein